MAVKAVLREIENCSNWIDGFGYAQPTDQFDFRYDEQDNFFLIINGRETPEVSTAFDFIEID